MKRLCFLLFIGICFVMPEFSHGQTWKTVGPDEINSPSLASSAYTSIAIAANGTPYIAYQNGTQNQQITVKKFDGTKWIVVGQPGFTDGYFPSQIFLAISPDGTPYVTFQTNANIYVRKLAGNSWVSDGHFISVGLHPSLSFAGDASPYLAYCGGYNYGFNVKKFQSGWQQLGDTLNISSGNSNSGKIIISGNGTPYVAYSAPVGNHDKISVKKYLSGQWRFVGNSGFTNPGAANVTLALTTDSIVYVAYTDSTNNNRVSVQQYKNGIWSATNSLFLSKGSANDLSITVAPDNVPYLAFTDGGNGSNASVMKYINGSWTNVGPTSISLSGVSGTSIAVGKDTVPYLCYTDNSLVDKVMVKKFLNNQWVDVGMGGASPEASSSLSLKVNKSGAIYTAFNDAQFGNKASVKTYVSGAWQYVGQPGISAAGAQEIIMDIANNGTPYIVYRDSTQHYEAVIKKFSGTNWVQVGATVSSGGSVNTPKIAIAPDGTPYVAYVDDGYGGKITVQKYAGGTWSVVGLPAFTPTLGNYLNLAIDQNSTPYIGYIDANSGNANVLKFTGTAWAPVGLTNFSPKSSTNLNLVIGPDGRPYVAYYDPSKYKISVQECTNNTWAYVGGQTASDSSASQPRMVFDQIGQLFLCYLHPDVNHTNFGAVKKLSQGAWTDAGNADIMPWGAYNNEMTIAPNGNLVYGYLDPQVFVRIQSPDSAAAAPVIASCSPVYGTTGTIVNIFGSNFRSTTSVNFGQVAASFYKIVSPSLIIAVIGKGASGMVSVTTSYGTGKFDGFRFSAAPPSITAFSPSSGNLNSNVTIKGKNFGATAAANIVHFGAVTASVISANDSTIIVKVPTGTTYQPISVTTNQLTAYTNLPFDVTFDSQSVIDQNSFATRQTFPCTAIPMGLLITDIDNDGKPDIVVSNDSVTFIHNISSTGKVSAVSQTSKAASGSPIFSADADGDGKLDIFYSDSGVSVEKNDSEPGSISFLYTQTVQQASNSSDFVLGDIDGDGKPDVVAFGSVIKNEGASSNYLYFDDPINLISMIGATPQSFAMADMDNDGKPDLIVTIPNYHDFNHITNYIEVLKNISTPDTVAFTLVPGQYITGYTPGKIIVADIDGDGKQDILITNQKSNTVTIYRNTSTNNISFASGIDLTTGAGPVALCVADFNGDGKPDIAVANADGNTISVFQNTGFIGAITFASSVNVNTGNAPTAVAAADIDGDGAPDLVVVNQNDATVSIFRNNLVQLILPNTNFTVAATSATCKGAADGSITVAAVQSMNYTMNIVGGSLNSSIQFTSSGTFNNLAAGTYDVCITIAGQNNFRQCYELVITEPKDLSLYSVVNDADKTITLALSGGAEYNLDLNGVLYTTADSSITLPLVEGNNKLAVSTNKLCQGTIRKIINISGQVSPYPVPFQNTLYLNLGDTQINNVSVEIHNVTDGKLVFSKAYVNQSGVIQLDVSGLDNGVYALNLSLDNSAKIFKIMKK